MQKDEQVDITASNTRLIIVFDTLYSVALFLLLATLFIAWRSSRIRRFSTWYMFLITWIVDALSKLLLVGQQASPRRPEFGLCIIQASLINATPVLYVSAVKKKYAVINSLFCIGALFTRLHTFFRYGAPL